jgi:hypothetical protein
LETGEEDENAYTKGNSSEMFHRRGLKDGKLED